MERRERQEKEMNCEDDESRIAHKKGAHRTLCEHLMQNDTYEYTMHALHTTY